MTQKLVAGLEPPYYTAVVTSILRPGAPEGYAETSARLHERVAGIPGFLGYESARAPGGIGITVAYFRDLDSLDAWRRDAEHRTAKQRGREEWYESYSLHIGKVEQSHAFERK